MPNIFCVAMLREACILGYRNYESGTSVVFDLLWQLCKSCLMQVIYGSLQNDIKSVRFDGKYITRPFKRADLLITDHMFRHVAEIADSIYLLANGKVHLTSTLEDLEYLGYARL